MQACAFLASFEPCMATAVCSQLERDFPDHFPDDPYDTEMIYDATLYALAWQRAVPLVELPRKVHDTFHASANNARTAAAPAAINLHVSVHPIAPFTCTIRPSHRGAYTCVAVRRISCASAARCAAESCPSSKQPPNQFRSCRH